MVLRCRSENRGALLVEALVSFGLMFIVALAVLSMQAHARKARVKGRDIVAATCLARSVLEQARTTGYDSLAFGETSYTESIQVLRENRSIPEKFVVTRNVRTGPLSGLKSVHVRVRWHAGEVVLENYVGK